METVGDGAEGIKKMERVKGILPLYLIEIVKGLCWEIIGMFRFTFQKQERTFILRVHVVWMDVMVKQGAALAKRHNEFIMLFNTIHGEAVRCSEA